MGEQGKQKMPALWLHKIQLGKQQTTEQLKILGNNKVKLESIKYDV